MLTSSLTEHQINLPDCRIFYRQGGTRSIDAPILFLHGWGISAEPYQEILELIAKQHFVIAPDLPSFAGSSYSKLIFEYETYARFLVSFLDALKIDRVHLVGHSIGGGISIAINSLAADRVASLVLVGSTGIPNVTFPEIVPIRAIEMTAQISLPKLKLQFIDIPQVFSRNLLFNTGNVIQALLLSLEKDLRPLLPLITAPCLLLWSEKDLTIPLSVGQEMAGLISSAKLMTVEEGYHEWVLWHPEKFVSIMLNFVKQADMNQPDRTAFHS